MTDLLVTLSRRRPDGSVEAVALTSEPSVVCATVTALERALRGPERARVLSLTRADEREMDEGVDP